MQESKTEKMAPSPCLRLHLFTDITSDTERHFHFRAVGRGLKMYEDTRWHNVFYFQFKAIFRLICPYYILISYVDSTDETRRLM